MDFGPVKALFTCIAGQDNRVVIPYGFKLGSLIPASAVRMRREAPRVKKLTEAHAILHHASRERGEKGRMIATYNHVLPGMGDQTATAMTDALS